MIEYLYIDALRLDRYYEQISSPVKYDKVPVWKVAVGLAGPKVEGTQVRPGRPPSTHEKILRLKEYIDKHNLASAERIHLFTRRGTDEEKPFILETLSARRARINRGNDVLNIWVSLRPDEAHSDDDGPFRTLYLIEDFRGDDDHHRTYSGYSSLYLLSGELEWLKHTPVGDPLEKLCKQDDATQHFALDPVGTLAAMGAQIGPERRIMTLYRFRASCLEMEAQDRQAITIIGYPIVIQEA
ncbi:MAG: hypothetical protein IIA72_19725 [Proteobacteria bacterium]|nr:hypothetical protein [Pseudomonadota bacterium]